MSMMAGIVSVLISLAMILTGAGAAGTPVSRTLTLSDVQLVYNGEAVALEPAVRMGVTTDGKNALFDFGVDANGEALFPVQLAADPDGITALFVKSGQAVSVPSATLDALMAQAEQMMAGQTQAMDPQSQQLFTFMKDEFFPAYIDLMKLATDEARAAEISAKAEALFGEMIDRGEGVESTYDYNDKVYDVTVYHYTLDAAQMSALADALYTLDPALQNYYNALFKLYGMMPEESGLNGLTSFADLGEKMDIYMSMALEESVNEAEQLDVVDGVLTIDMSGMVAAMAQAEGDAAELPQIPPIEMVLHASQLGAEKDAQIHMFYTIDTQSVSMNCAAYENGESKTMDMMMDLSDGEQSVGSLGVYAISQPGEEAGSEWSTVTFNLMIPSENVSMSLMVNDNKAADGSDDVHVEVDLTPADEGKLFGYLDTNRAADGSGTCEGCLEIGAAGVSVVANVKGANAADGTGATDVSLSFTQGDNSASLSFRLTVTGDAIADLSEGAEVTVIDDLSQEGLNALMGDQGFQGKMMQVAGSFMGDAQKLMADESVAAVIAAFTPITDVETTADEAAVEATDDEAAVEEDADAEGDGDQEISIVFEPDEDDEIDLEGLDFDDEVEDDGVLPFDEPTFTWLPEGWDVIETNIDTAYDMVDMTIMDETGENSLYAMFYANPETPTRYLVGEDGAMTAVEGRDASILDTGEGSWSVVLEDNGAYVNLFVYSETIGLEDIGRIVAGLTY